MVILLAPTINNNCESFTHNPLTCPQGNPILLSLIVTHKEFIDNTSEFEYDFVGGKHGYACVA